MSLQAEYNYMASGNWAHPDESECPCRGGWLLSDLDTWHQCPYHGHGVPHPEFAMEEAEWAETIDTARDALCKGDDEAAYLLSWALQGDEQAIEALERHCERRCIDVESLDLPYPNRWDTPALDEDEGFGDIPF